MVKIKDMPVFKRPREKLFEQGPKALKDGELLSILLRTGYYGSSALEVANRILKTKNLAELAQLGPKRLAAIKGLGKSRAATIIAALELSERILVKDMNLKINNAEDAFKVTSYLAEKKKEYLVALYLDARNQLIKKQTISIGILTANLIHPREVFAPAIENNAAKIIIIHNHPSGDPQPSTEDIEITKNLIEAGKIIGIELVDHLILTKNKFFSFKESRS